MTMRFKVNKAITSSIEGSKVMFEFLSFMTTASPTGPGWSLVASRNDNNGSSIASATDLDGFNANNAPWFVVQEPSPGTRQYCFFRTSSNELTWSIAYSRSAGFTGFGTNNKPTATDEVTFVSASNITTSGAQVWQYMADDASPFGFVCFGWVSGTMSDENGGWGQIPMDGAQAASDTDPIVMVFMLNTSDWIATQLSSESASNNVARVAGYIPGQTPPTGFVTIPACLNTSSGITNQVIPNNVPQDLVARDFEIPILFIRRSGLSAPNGYKGLSNFMQWTGVSRTTGDTLATKTRIVVGDVSFPWDGATTPSAT